MKIAPPVLSVVVAHLLLAACAPATKEVFACDLFQTDGGNAGRDGQGHQSGGCVVLPGSAYEVASDPRLESALKSWTDFSHHLYFHSRITPGLRVNFSGLGKKERSALEQAHCSWTLEDPRGKLRPVGGHMEGIRIDEDGLWCFDYFGTMLLAFVRENQIQSEPVRLDVLFPLRLHLSATTGFIQPDPALERSISLTLPDSP